MKQLNAQQQQPQREAPSLELEDVLISDTLLSALKQYCSVRHTGAFAH